jgi:N-ethylmaleimide reductase
MNFPLLFSHLEVGPYRLNHRIVMAPLTRMRAEKESFAPRPLNAEYYGQRATPGGLIIAEASPVMSTGRGNAGTPGIYSDQQVEGWRDVVNAVHGKGGVIFLQLWHVGACLAFLVPARRRAAGRAIGGADRRFEDRDRRRQGGAL